MICMRLCFRYMIAPWKNKWERSKSVQYNSLKMMDLSCLICLNATLLWTVQLESCCPWMSFKRLSKTCKTLMCQLERISVTKQFLPGKVQSSEISIRCSVWREKASCKNVYASYISTWVWKYYEVKKLGVKKYIAKLKEGCRQNTSWWWISWRSPSDTEETLSLKTSFVWCNSKLSACQQPFWLHSCANIF